MTIKTNPIYAADDGAGAAGAAGAGAGGNGAAGGDAAAAAAAAAGGGAPARPDWLPASLDLDKQFLGDQPSAPDTISRLYNYGKGLRDTLAKQGAVPEKPEAYTIEDKPEIRKLFGDPDDKGMQLLRTAAQKSGITDKQFPTFLSTFAQTFVEAGLLPAPIDPKAEAQKLVGRDFRGNDAELVAEAKRRESAAEAWADGLVTNGTLTDEEAANLKTFTGTAAGIQTLEKLQRLAGGGVGIQTGGQGGNAGVTPDQVRARTRDPRYFVGSKEYDPAFAAETERLLKQHFPR